MSDIPFFFFLILSIFLLENAIQQSNATLLVLSAITTGFLICIRSAGWFWFLSIVLFFLSQNIHSIHVLNRLSILKQLIFTVITGITYIMIQIFLFPADSGGYIAQTQQAGLELFLHNFKLLISFWNFYFTENKFEGIGYIVCFLSIIGILNYFKNQRLIAIFLITYLLIMLIVWPHFGFRFYLPAILFMLLFSILAIQIFMKKMSSVLKNMIWLLVIGLTMYLFYPENRKVIQISAVQDSPECKECIETWSYIKNNMAMDAVIAFHRPRALAYYTNRKSFILPEMQDIKTISQTLEETSSRFILLDLFNREYQESAEFYTKTSNQAYLIWKNNRFELYQIM